MQYTCPHCNKVFDVPGGTPFPERCPSCGQAIQLPPEKTSGLAVASLVLGIGAFFITILIPDILAIVFGVKARRAIARSAGRLRGAGMALAGMILGIVHLAIVPILIIAILMPAITGAWQMATRTKSQASLHQIGKGLTVYAVTYHNQFPPDLQTLVEEGFITREVLKNPRRREHDPAGDYAYVAGLTRMAPPDLVIAYEKVDDRAKSDGLNVLFTDGHVEWLKSNKFEEALDKTEKWLAEHGLPPPQLE